VPPPNSAFAFLGDHCQARDLRLMARRRPPQTRRDIRQQPNVYSRSATIAEQNYAERPRTVIFAVDPASIAA